MTRGRRRHYHINLTANWTDRGEFDWLQRPRARSRRSERIAHCSLEGRAL